MPSKLAFRNAQLRHAQYYLALLRIAHEGLVQNRKNNLVAGSLNGLFELDWENVQRGQAWTAINAPSDPIAANLCSDFATSGRDVIELRLHPRERIRWHLAAWSVAQKLNIYGTKVATLNALGLDYRQLGEIHRGIEYFEKELHIAHGWGAKLSPLNNLGNAYMELQDFDMAIRYFKKALLIARVFGKSVDKAVALFQLSKPYYLDNLPRSIYYLEKALGASRRADDWSTEHAVLHLLGQAYQRAEGPNRSIKFYENQLRLIIGRRDSRGRVVVLGYLSDACTALGDFGRALEFCNQQLQMAREMRDWRLELNALGYLASTYTKKGESRRAIEYYLQQLQIARRWGDWRKEGGVLQDLATVYEEVGEIDLAIECYELELQLLQVKGEQFWEAALLQLMGTKFQTWGNQIQADVNFKAGRKIFESIDVPRLDQVKMLPEHRNKKRSAK